MKMATHLSHSVESLVHPSPPAPPFTTRTTTRHFPKEEITHYHTHHHTMTSVAGTASGPDAEERPFWQGQRFPVDNKPTGPRETMKAHFVAATGEFLGTFFFLWMAYAGHLMVASQADTLATTLNGGPTSSTVTYISLVYAFALMVNVWAFFRVSGGQFNPAVTTALTLVGAVPPLRALVLIPSQLVASICAGFLASAMLPTPIATVNTTLAPGISTVQGLFIEAFLTFELVIVILMLAVEKSKTSFLAPVGIGLALLVAELAGVYYTGGSLNPARSLGCAVAGGSFPVYHWIYWLGPVMGAAAASAYHWGLKWLRYERANPGQDGANGGFAGMDGV